MRPARKATQPDFVDFADPPERDPAVSARMSAAERCLAGSRRPTPARARRQWQRSQQQARKDARLNRDLPVDIHCRRIALTQTESLPLSQCAARRIRHPLAEIEVQPHPWSGDSKPAVGAKFASVRDLEQRMRAELYGGLLKSSTTRETGRLAAALCRSSETLPDGHRFRFNMHPVWLLDRRLQTGQLAGMDRTRPSAGAGFMPHPERRATLCLPWCRAHVGHRPFRVDFRGPARQPHLSAAPERSAACATR